MLKRILALAAAILVPLCAVAGAAEAPGYAGAMAAIACWTSPEEEWYHLDRDCGGEATERYPISPMAAEAFERTPCPACAAPQLRLSACERAGTWVFRVPQLLLDHMELIPTSEEEPDRLTERVCSLYFRDHPQDRTARAALPDGAGGELFMNARRIGDWWYLVITPDAPYAAERPLRWRAVEMDEGRRVTAGAAFEEYVPAETESSAERVFQRTYDGFDVNIYRALEANIAVVHLDDADPERLLIEAEIGGTEIPCAGYVNEAGQTTCCLMVTDAELGMLVAGSVPSVRRVDMAKADEASDPAVSVGSADWDNTVFDW